MCNQEKGFRKDRQVAYFSMEIGLEGNIPTYSGGLGVLAGDTIKAFLDLKIPVVALTLIHSKGYFHQIINEAGEQGVGPVQWNPSDFMEKLPERAKVNIEGREVSVAAWIYHLEGKDDYVIPVLFLDTDLEENDERDRSLTHYLYGGDQRYRIAQEIVLGIGGFRILQKLGYTKVHKFHMNEGHSSFLALELLRQNKEKTGKDFWDIEGVRDCCVFTTHTPVPAGHDQFSYNLVREVLGEFIPWDIMKKLGGEDYLNMTLLALNLSKYVNGVAKSHEEVSRNMFPGYTIDSITNGIHSVNWVSKSFAKLFDKHIKGWCTDSFALRYSLAIPREEIWQAHMEAKEKLINIVNQKTNAGLSYKNFTIGFARRITEYKRPTLIFSDIKKLAEISEKAGTIQIIFAGKAHPSDERGRELVKEIFHYMDKLKDSVKIAFVENYNIGIAKLLVSGVDLWLNTPQRPKEASGTSGMKAAHNGVPHFSVLDGWWYEGHIEGITGWSIGPWEIEYGVDENVRDAQEMYDKLEKVILPLFYNERDKWIDIMKHSIAINASFFNTQRMVQQYTVNAYFI